MLKYYEQYKYSYKSIYYIYIKTTKYTVIQSFINIIQTLWQS